MASRRVEAEIDRLFQLAPDEFTAARNALAKEGGADAPEVRRLTKPAIPAWAVNQLYWKRRQIYDALIEASKELRQVHKAVLAGRPGDLRTAGKVHDEALETASKAALSILQDGGHPVADATRHAILTTLRALPSDEPDGRLIKALQPGGFEMLSGLSIGGKGSLRLKSEVTRAEPTKKSEPKPAKTVARGKTAEKEMTAAEKRAHAQALSRAREAAAKADRELRAAEHTAQREEFEAARTAREAEKAVKQIELAREAVEAAQQELEAAKAAAVTATRVRDAAERRSREAQRAVDAARGRHSQAANNLSTGRSSAQG
jgi:hypothetical protein